MHKGKSCLMIIYSLSKKQKCPPCSKHSHLGQLDTQGRRSWATRDTVMELEFFTFPHLLSTVVFPWTLLNPVQWVPLYALNIVSLGTVSLCLAAPWPITSLQPFMTKPVKHLPPSTQKRHKCSWRNYLLTRDSEITVHFPSTNCQFISADKWLGVPLLRGGKIIFPICSSACEVWSTCFIEKRMLSSLNYKHG